MSALGMGATLCARSVRKGSLMHSLGLSGGGGVFSPLSLSPVLWLKADVGLFQDVAGTIPATADADPVGLWKDQSGHVADASQGTAGSKPILKLAIQNGRNVVRFDAVDDGMLSGLTIAAVPFTVFVVYSSRIGGAGQRRCVQGSSNWLLGPYQATYRYFNGGFIDGPLIVGGAFALACAQQITGTATYFVNSVSKGTNANNGAFGTMSLGATGLAAEPLDGDIAELVVFGSALSTADRLSMETYLNGRWAIY